MKFNFKKIASVLTGAVMLSSTVALAAAASFPAPFVKTNGAGDYAVVYGSATTTTDGVAAADINSWLAGKVTTTVTPTVTNASLSDGDVVQIAKAKDKFNLGDSADDFDSSLTSDDLPVVLADGTYYNDDNDDYVYEQTIEMGELNLSWNQNDKYNDKKPFAGFELPAGQNVLTYTLEFTDNGDAESGTWDSNSKLKGTVIKMLGRDYYISGVSNSSQGIALTLLDTANSVRINEGETQTMTVGDKSYDVKVVSVSNGDTETVSLEVNGVEITSELEEGDTAKVRGEDTYVGVKTITSSSRESSIQSAVVTIGTGQLTLENGQEVELNGDPLSDFSAYENYVLTSTVTPSATALASIGLTWTVKKDNKVFVSPGTSITMPGLEAIKFSMGDFVVPEGEVTTVQDGSDTVVLSTVVKDGDLDLDLLNANETGFLGLGADTDEVLVTVGRYYNGSNVLTTSTASTSRAMNVTLDVDLNSYFAATWIDGDEAETAIYQITSVDKASDDENVTVIENMLTGDEITLSEIFDTDDSTEVEFKLIASNEDNQNATIEVSPTSSGDVYIDRIATENGMVVTLPTTGTGATSTLTFTERNADSDDIGAGSSFTATVRPSADGTEVSAVSGPVMYEEEDNSDVSVGYVISDLATYVKFDDVEDGAATLEVQYHPSEVYANVYVTESKVAFGEGSGNGGGSAGTVLVTDSQVSSVQGKNLVVVGGSCVNTVAAKLLGSETPLCEAAWMTATNNVGAGSFLIQTFANPWTTGKVATLVAGYDASDTESAVSALKTETSIDTTVGKKYVKLAGTTLQLV